MIIEVGRSGEPRLSDVDNFRAFKVVSALTGETRDAVLSKVGRVEDNHLWVPRAWIERHGRLDDKAWLAGLGNMVDYAAKAGWIDADGAIRAHIENG